jgi:hypothetical protein
LYVDTERSHRDASVLHRLRLVDIEQMADTTLRAISALFLNWQEFMTRDIDARALGKPRSR